jgi:uncharacterized protein YkwD
MGRRNSALASAAVFLLLSTACRGALSSPVAPSSSAPGTSAFSAEVGFCVAETNRYRASRSLPPLARSESLEEYAARAARNDGTAHEAHQYAHQTNLGNGTARAENAILWWSLRYYGSVQDIVRLGIADMWQQGEGGAHYRNLVGNYSELGCGVFVNGDEVTVVQAFR